MAKKQTAATPYRQVLSHWRTKELGPKPTLAQLEAAHALGCRPGKQALAVAMCLRQGGATDGQMKMACILNWGSSGSHHNKRGDLVDRKLVRNVISGEDASGHKVYTIALTPKGEALVRPKVKPVEAPAQEAVAQQ